MGMNRFFVDDSHVLRPSVCARGFVLGYGHGNYSRVRIQINFEALVNREECIRFDDRFVAFQGLLILVALNLPQSW
jgi:hypothetical protein